MHSDFDVAAPLYDDIFTYSNIGKAQRKLVFKYINPIISQEKKLSILELNCGTGADAISFAAMNHDVIATDISEGMIAIAKAKNHPKNLEFKVQDINTITENTFDKKFDLIFSDFGGINCLSHEQLHDFIKKTSDLLLPNGKLVLVLMPKNCLWERFYFTLKGDKTKANRRNTTKSVVANVDGVGVETWYYNPQDISAIANKFYTTKKIKPIGVTIPPSYLEQSFVAKFPMLNIFKGLDSILTASALAKYADHFLIELELGC
ncbi:Ubiquinone biosynthesis O-methyltransferase [Kordia antarctica]|uniref:Ubiquinone biosynthesis O-methyltransferase n=1 Tax=Kordia antarctica TaxID=1218801 RepID=A0A7L4ZNR0_9FLAO|nr:class I SAM-dependent methyltransferase [Kordia antarctica]QHI38131.1 Ubiquinone biosynthesis O-methyltransferase [Kordia antarctica]